MKTEAGNRDPEADGRWGAMIREHGEKLGLGAALLAIAFAALLGMPGKDAEAEELRARLQDLSAEQGRLHPDRVPQRRVPDSSRVLRLWDGVSARSTPHPFAGTLVPEYRPVAKTPPPPPPTVPVVLPAIVLGALDRTPYSVNVAWSVPAVARDKKSRYLEFTHFTVERKAEGESWTALAEKLDPNATGFRDDSVEPKGSYAYRVTGMTAVGPVHVEGTVTVPDRWKFSFRVPQKGTAIVTIEKIDREHGRVQIQHIHKEGDEIGRWIETGGKDPVTQHTVLVNQRARRLDFNTGVKLRAIRPVEVPVIEHACKYPTTGQGRGPCEHVRSVIRVSTYAIDLEDEDGGWTIYEPAPAERDHRCLDHRAKR